MTFTGGEVRDPGRTLPLALVVGCGSVVGLYLLANVAYVVTLSLREIQGAPNDRVGTEVMRHVLGDRGAVVMAAAILISTFGCVNGLVLAGARVYYAMARDGLFFAAAGTTNRRHVPAVALAAQCVWASLLTLPVTVETVPAKGGVEVRQPLQPAPRIHHPGRRHLLHADGRRRDRPAAQGAGPGAALPDVRLSPARR